MNHDIPSDHQIEFPASTVSQHSEDKPELEFNPLQPSESSKQDLPRSFELIRLLGQGPVAEVYLGRHLGLGRVLVLKKLRPDATDSIFVERLRRLARSTACREGKQAVWIYGSFLDSDKPWALMEYIQEGGLDRWMKEHSESDLASRCRLAKQLCQALAEVHRSGSCHGNLKPSNIFFRNAEKKIGDSSRIIFADYACSDDDEPPGPQTISDKYLPHDHQGKIGQGEDVFALGIIITELLSGKTLTDVKQIRYYLKGVHGLPSKACKLLARMTHSQSCIRPANAAGVLRQLRHIHIESWPVRMTRWIAGLKREEIRRSSRLVLWGAMKMLIWIILAAALLWGFMYVTDRMPIQGLGTVSHPYSVRINVPPAKSMVVRALPTAPGSSAGPGADLVAIDRFKGQFFSFIHLGNGLHRQGPQLTISPDSMGMINVLTGEVTGDDYFDIIIGNSQLGQLMIYEGKGKGRFEHKENISGLAGLADALLVDFNRDGRLDLVSVSMGNRVKVHLGNGRGKFNNVRTYIVGQFISSVAVLDVTGKTSSNIVAADYVGNCLWLIDTNKKEIKREETPLLKLSKYHAGKPVQISSADLDGNGVQDLILVVRDPGAVVVFWSGHVDWDNATVISTQAPASWARAADFNRDGQMELVVHAYRANHLSVFVGLGQRQFRRPPLRIVSPMDVPLAGHADLADIDGDGLTDIIFPIPGELVGLFSGGRSLLNRPGIENGYDQRRKK